MRNKERAKKITQFRIIQSFHLKKVESGNLISEIVCERINVGEKDIMRQMRRNKCLPERKIRLHNRTGAAENVRVHETTEIQTDMIQTHTEKEEKPKKPKK